jgi:hypothetical protein
VGLGVGLDGWGKSRLIGNRTPDRPNPSEWLYPLSYPGRFVDFKYYPNMNELFKRHSLLHFSLTECKHSTVISLHIVQSTQHKMSICL